MAGEVTSLYCACDSKLAIASSPPRNSDGLKLGPENNGRRTSPAN